MMYYSAKLNAFFDDPAYYHQLPDDLKEISDELYARVMTCRSPDDDVIPGPDGLPMCQRRPGLDGPSLGEQQKVDMKMSEANQKIQILADAIDLGIASQEEKRDYDLWRKYRVLLSRVPQQPGFPAKIDWPTPPGTD
ncbi:tail fiber assembly protein [Chromobacterium violaceum]|uniref:tail fiber assembly protein n=1 Tax=Chromobacterium violaceum TaxID=536 RepID=UPI00111C1C6B|nr:tail fiber assembly protein [Chromobacterium violaceum]